MKNENQKSKPLVGAVGLVLFAAAGTLFWTGYPPKDNSAQTVTFISPAPDVVDSASILRAYADSTESANIRKANKVERLAKSIASRKQKKIVKCNPPTLLAWHKDELIEPKYVEYKGYWIIDIDSMNSVKDTVHLCEMDSACIEALPVVDSPKKKNLWQKVKSIFKSNK